MTSFQWSVFHAKKHKSEFRRGFLIEFLNVNSASVINALQKIDIISQKRFTGTRGTLTCLALIRMCIMFKTLTSCERKQGTVPFLERQKLKILPNPFWKKTSTTFQKCSDLIICIYDCVKPIVEKIRTSKIIYIAQTLKCTCKLHCKVPAQFSKLET